MTQILMLVFPARGGLTEAAEQLFKLDYIKVKHAALIARAEGDEVTILDNDINPNEGAIAGGTLGSLMGMMGIAQLGALLIPGVGAIIALGAGALVGALVGGGVGGVAADAIDMGIKDRVLKQMASHLEKDRAALVIEATGDANLAERLQADLNPLAIEFATA
ncbi:MAG: hypothetical protein SGI73_15620 [Chloroflexota bacterium]|nr:hypothetical protein [Chloroflexota bacterium]